MITINLLPAELRPIKRTPVPYIASLAILALTVLAVAAVYLDNFRQIHNANNLLNQHKQERDDLQPIIDEANELANEKKQLQEQVLAISEIIGDRIIWSEQLYHLSRLALENMWYSEMEVKPRTTIVTKTQFNPQKKKEETVKVKQTRQFLAVSGYVVPGELGEPNIGPYTTAAETDEEFNRTFTLDPQITLIDTQFEGISVRRFELEFLVKTGGASK